MLFSVTFTANVGIGTYFGLLQVLGTHTQTTVPWTISQTIKHHTLKLLFLKWHDQSQKFRLKLVKNRQKALQRD